MKKLTCMLRSLSLALALTSCDVALVLDSIGDMANDATSNAQESTEIGEEPPCPIRPPKISLNFHPVYHRRLGVTAEYAGS